MKMVIVGCGIGGLTAAHALTQQGLDVELIERAPQLMPVGAGISLQPNAMQAFKRLGLFEPIFNASWPANCAQILSSTGSSFISSNFRRQIKNMAVYR